MVTRGERVTGIAAEVGKGRGGKSMFGGAGGLKAFGPREDVWAATKVWRLSDGDKRWPKRVRE